MPITISITDGTTTATEIVIPDNRANITAAALSAAVNDTSPPANNVRAIRAALAVWIRQSRQQQRTRAVVEAARVSVDATLATIANDEATAAP